MAKASLATFGSQVKNHRKNKTLRDAANDIGISAPTLMRVESGRIPDVETFGKLCKWLGVNPGDYLGTSTAISAPLENPVVSFSNSAAPLVVSAHFRVDRLPKPEVAQALAKMILFAVNRQKPTETLDGA